MWPLCSPERLEGLATKRATWTQHGMICPRDLNHATPAGTELGAVPSSRAIAGVDSKAFGTHFAADSSLLTLPAAVVISVNGPAGRSLAFVPGQVGEGVVLRQMA